MSRTVEFRGGPMDGKVKSIPDDVGRFCEVPVMPAEHIDRYRAGEIALPDLVAHRTVRYEIVEWHGRHFGLIEPKRLAGRSAFCGDDDVTYGRIAALLTDRASRVGLTLHRDSIERGRDERTHELRLKGWASKLPTLLNATI